MASKAEQARMKAGDIVQYRKVGKARLVERSDFDRAPRVLVDAALACRIHHRPEARPDWRTSHLDQ
jgi:hypothetical protein